jgi:hypothetical protein
MADRYLLQYDRDLDSEVLQALENLRHLREKQAVYSGNPVAEARAEHERQVG